MDSRTVRKVKAADLLRRAEARLRAGGPGAAAGARDEAREVRDLREQRVELDRHCQELELQRLELEAQNQELRRLRDDAVRREAELRTANQSLLLATRSADLGIWDLDLRSGVLAWDDRTLELYGVAREAFTGTQDAWRNAIHPEDRDRVVAEAEAAARAGGSFEHEFRVLLPDGTVRHILGNGQVLRDEQGEPARMIGVVRNVTGRRRAEAARRLIQEHLNLALASSGMGIFEWDIRNDIRHWDACAHRLLGSDPGRFSGTTEAFLERVCPADRDEVRACMNRALEQGAYQAEFRAQWPDGSLHPLAVRGKLFRDERGRPASLLGVLWDCSAQKAHEDALLREKTFTRALLDNLVEGVVACDERGVVVLINRTLREWQGRDALDLGQTQAADHAELLDPDGATPMASGSTPLARAFHGQAFRDLGMVIAARGRSPRHVLCNGTPILDPMGRRLGAVVVEHDVTERRRAGEAMRRIMVAVEQSPITVVITDAQGNIEYVNPTFSQLTGYSAAEVIGRNPRILNAGEAPAESYRKLWATILAGETWKGEFHNRKKNGELFWEAATIAPIRDSEGRITSFVALKEDITEAKRNEQARVESEIRFRELFETTKDGIAMTDPEGRYQDCNQAFLDLLGLDSKADLVGRSYEAFTPAEYLEGERRLIAEARVADDGRCHDFEKEYLRPSGERVPVEVRGWIRRDRDRQAIGIWAMARDITERVQARRALEQLNGELEERIRRRTSLLESANAELDAFSYSVSHDLRAPLRGIDGFSAALLEECGDQLGDEARHYLQRVRAGTQRMGLLIDDLLKLSRVSRGPLDLQPLDLGAMARGLVAELRQADPGRSLDLRVEPDLTAGGDHGLVRSVLENLLGNAWKYTAKVPAPRIELFRAALPDGSPGFCVRDNGAGFDMAYAGKLFTAFQRLHPSHEFEGSGIGLAIVQRIIRRHGGQVWAQGAVGEGASFFFSLPEPP